MLRRSHPAAPMTHLKIPPLATLWVAACCLACRTAAVQAQPAESADAQSAAEDTSPERLTQRLEAAKQARLDVELKTGKSFLRCKLLSVTRDPQGRPKTLKIQDANQGRTITVSFASIRSLSIDREMVYEAAKPDRRSGKEAAATKQARAAAEEDAKWLAVARENKVPVWENLSPQEHAAAVKEHEQMIAKIKQLIPGMELYETHDFMFLSNMPRNQVIPYATSLDKMHDMMCGMYRIKKGATIWRGKCLVVAFMQESQFQAFEAQFFQVRSIEGVYGLCHQSGTGRVVISCYRGHDPNDFGQMLVHETSHGFVFRYRTMVEMPSWVNEGMAEWIGQALVPTSTTVQRKEKQAFQLMQASRSLNGLFSANPIQGVHYGMASSLTGFLIGIDKRKYADFIDGIKQGKTWEQSLKDSYQSTPNQLVAAYGRAIGIPDLQP